eukprot:CAMPEP_0113699266 /NCGR_PEP_ID=MMETSP0038_2-20120614/23202_1 /TAXON_ID=2898 /ORGANISM="Cryptomonas paramecium" /LENGTH=151 /DNA_ID=CAMNT_0000622585 /DNA_START=453 /DNA_END=905 /DNA_ORIENTATION=+ /assembly_acc=CAM_ASM_000170
MADQLRHVLQDLEWWPSGPWPGSSEYVSDCSTRSFMTPLQACATGSDCGTFDCGNGHFSAGEGLPCFVCRGNPSASPEAALNATAAQYCSQNAETFSCLSPVGWAFTVAMTYVGFLCFFLATFWNADLVGKLRAVRDKWRALRGGGGGGGG